MPYIQRDASGNIKTVSLEPFDGCESVSDDAPELAGFSAQWAKDENFSVADAEFVRVLEDLIDTLVLKNIIRHTDLPVAAQRKINARKGMRNRLNGALQLFREEPPLI